MPVPLPWRSLRRTGLLAAAVLTACALPGLRIDLAATAPVLAGHGDAGFGIRTGAALAQQHFNQGLQQAYAFNEVEAVRQFKAALAADPGCALCAWGVAWQLGPNINATERGDLREAARYADLAQHLAHGGPPREQALASAMALRYGQGDGGQPLPAPLRAPVCAGAGGKAPHPLDLAYAERLRSLLPQFPDDADLLSLWAEAEMLAATDDWWPDDKPPAPGIVQVAQRLEAALQHQPGHTGLNHYLIHAVDASPEVRRALPAADRLAALAPLSPHLVHMPSHIHVRVGRFADATRANQQALALDDSLRAELQRQGFAVSKDWRGHNRRFAWFAALMEGRGDLALSIARETATRAAGARHVWGELARSLPLLTLARLERWPAVLAEPAPAGTLGIAQALQAEARGIALLRSGRPDEARALLASATSAAATVAASHAGPDEEARLLRGLADGAREHLAAELALADGRRDDALAAQSRAVQARKLADAAEPPLTGPGMRLAQAELLARVGDSAAAEAAWRADLVHWPDSGWALRGLVPLLQAQGRSADAAPLAATLARQWAQADSTLR